MAQLSLLHTELAKCLASANLVLRQVAKKTCCCLPKLRLLSGLLAHGLADVGQLPCGGLTKLGTLRFQVAHLAARLHAKAGLLSGQLSGLLLEAPLRLSALAKQAADALKQLRLLARLAGLCLLELSHLHSGLSVKARFLKALLRGLKAELALLASGLRLQLPCLCELLRGALAEACLLPCNLCLLPAQLANALASLHLTALLLFKGLHGLCLRLAEAL